MRNMYLIIILTIMVLGLGCGKAKDGTGVDGSGPGAGGGRAVGDEAKDPARISFPTVTTAAEFTNKLKSGASFELGDDLALSDWKTVEKYKGRLYGNGKKLTIKFKADAIGLIRYIEPGGGIQDLTIELREDFRTNNTITAAGPLAGTNKGKVEGVKVIGSGKVINENKSAATGGLIGINYATGEVVNCTSEVAVEGGQKTGGLVGHNTDATKKGRITNSYATGAVTGTIHVGGLVGYNTGTIENSYATGAVMGENIVGGFVGWNTNNGQIDKCYSRAKSVTESVTGSETAVGRFVGQLGMDMNPTASITNSFVMTITSPTKDVGDGASKGVEAKATGEIKATDFSAAGWEPLVWKAFEDGKWPTLAWQK